MNASAVPTPPDDQNQKAEANPGPPAAKNRGNLGEWSGRLPSSEAQARGQVKGQAKAARLTKAHATVGNQECSAWLVAPRVVWIQTRLARLAQLLSQLQDSKLVAYGVGGGYLRTYELLWSLSRAERWIERNLIERTTA